MKYLAVINSSIILVLIPFLFKLIRKKQQEKKTLNNEIRQPLMYLYIGLFGLIFFDLIIPIFCFLEVDQSMTWYESLIFCIITSVPFNILYIYLMLLSLNWKVIVYDTYVEYFNIFKKKSIFQFSDYLIKISPASIRIVKQITTNKNKRKNKCFVNISNYCSNYNVLNQKYKEYSIKTK